MKQQPEMESARSLSTSCVQAGLRQLASVTLPLAPPIWQTSAFAYPDLETMEAIAEGRQAGFVYSRYGLPNHVQIEQTLAELEGASDAVVTASGMAAIAATLFALLSPGQRIVADTLVYRGTRQLLERDLARFGVRVLFIDCSDLTAVEQALAQPTRILWVDVLTNPTLQLRPLPQLAALAEQKGALLVVDNTFATPLHCQPLRWGARLVVHSTTKLISGHHDATGGVVVGAPDLIDLIRQQVIRFGSRGGAFDAWLILRSLATLPVRAIQSSATALLLAMRLATHPAVTKVHYPGLPGYLQRRLAERLLQRGFGAMLSFELAGGESVVREFLRRLRLIRFAETLGGSISTIVHPATTSHRALSRDERPLLGISDGLLRLSVGLEDPADLLADLWSALDGLPARS